MLKNIAFIAGDRAFEIIKAEGLKPDRVRVVPGAAGGPKWLVLGGIDRYLFGSFFKKRSRPLFLLGSSIGTWRFAALAQDDPVAAIDRFEAAYLEQRYSRYPSTGEVSAESARILDAYLPDGSAERVLSHPFIRLCMLSVRSRNLFSASGRPALAAGMALATLCNIASRQAMGLFFERTLFFDRREIPPFVNMEGFPLNRVPLTRDNLKPAIMASGSIPLVMNGVAGIPGAPGGVYRDGGMIDYHIDIPMEPDPDHIVLYPHYTDAVIPGWLDKHLAWRRAAKRNMRNVLIVCPSRSFVESLPYKKIPDRNDFMKFYGRDDERLVYWNRAIEGGAVLGEEFRECVDSGRISSMLKPY